MIEPWSRAAMTPSSAAPDGAGLIEPLDDSA